MWLRYALIALVGYFIGCVSNARWIARINKKDISVMGSGNPGTMNVMRSLGTGWGILTLLCDVLKGVAPALIGLIWCSDTGLYFGGFGAIVGHVYPVTFKFRGGKGIATSIGVFLVASPAVAGIAFLGCVVCLLLTQYGSLGNLLFVAVMTVVEGIRLSGNVAASVLLFLTWVLIWYSHRANIVHLIVGSERKSHIMKTLSKIKEKPKNN